MSLVEHLIELRNRTVIAAVAIVLGTIPGWYAYEPIFNALVEPLHTVGGQINYESLTAPFSVHMVLSIWVGLLLSAPIWLYQLWAFIVPGLTKKEKWTARAFIFSIVPLLFAGCYVGYLTLPKAIQILLGFSLDTNGDVNIIPAMDYFAFVTRFILAFGISFLLPVFLVALNMVHVLPSWVMLKWWRAAVITIFIFAAAITPTPDPFTMLALAGPMTVLYFVAYGVARLLDRARGKKRPDWLDVDDDHASVIEAGDLD